MSRKQQPFKRGSTSYKILFLTIAFVMLATALLTPIFLVDGGNRTLGIILAAILGILYFLILIYFIYQWLKIPDFPDHKNDPKGKV